MKKKTKALLVEALKAAVAAFIGAITAAFSGCTTVITPADEAPCVSVTGAVPFGFQYNGNAAKVAAEK